jgi:hypothetical protein
MFVENFVSVTPRHRNLFCHSSVQSDLDALEIFRQLSLADELAAAKKG